VILHLPDEIILPLNLTEAELRLELAISLYAAKKISFGKARQLADTDWFTFRKILAERGIPAHYDLEDFEQDLKSLSHLS
jgi:predicted HTH domain antitoxin